MFVIYHMTGFIATERESGMTQLIDAMMPIRRRWVAQLARVVSYHVAFSLLYLPGWVVGSIVLRANIWSNTSIGVVLVYYVLAGLAMASAAILVSSFFQKAQLSGVTALLATVLLGILAQALTDPGPGVVAVLSLLFTPCNVVFFLITMARWERARMGTNLTEVAPNSSFELPAIVFWIFLIIQIVVYPLLGLLIEGRLFGTSAKGRTVLYEQPTDGAHNGPAVRLDGFSNAKGRTVLYDQPTDGSHNGPAVRLDGFSKYYPPSAFQRLMSVFGKPPETVKAVDGLTLDAPRGMILCLLGSNGSGKSTTLDSIAGTNRLTSGSITIDGTGGLGIAPQKNVLWDELTVEEHLKIFNRLKAPGQTASKQEIRDLVQAIDLSPKRKAFSKTLSGGQKRKLQLGMMLTGGSAVCCVDEVSSGLDPLSRRKIWDILLAERGRRTIILTTHFLDEADLLADHIVFFPREPCVPAVHLLN
ncbi:ABC transporter A family member 2 like protein [Verticillium longisporum]|nr:ABC transporter A family member 2 like protein [Verticillium longisporum]